MKKFTSKTSPSFTKNFFESGIIYVRDLLFELNNIDSYNAILNIINKTFFFSLGRSSTCYTGPFKNNHEPYIGNLSFFEDQQQRL